MYVGEEMVFFETVSFSIYGRGYIDACFWLQVKNANKKKEDKIKYNKIRKYFINN